MNALLRSVPCWMALVGAVACSSAAQQSSSQQDGLGGGNHDRPCTAMAAMRGLGLDIDPAFAPKVESATLSVCWAGACQSPTVYLSPATKTVDQGCQGQVCSGQAVPTGGKMAYIPVPELPTQSVQITLNMADASGAAHPVQTLDVVPTLVYPNGADCGGEAPQANLVVAADGTLHVR
ncbi:hypothetical protein LVJ94_21355 [Pendulispora rubella]|uniref:Secreted protein n=1 Tax=Pendulispora rubella TaxID=2741070 RepID=A0ABZ2LJP3_9BACT